jgi:protein-S-isoprenylcysteine O-methyltransferase Ste14
MKLGKFLYKYRSLTPVPLIIALLVLSRPLIFTLVIGFLVSVMGELLRLLSIAYTGLTTRSRNVQTGMLITNGPYGVVRNPIYVGNFFLSLGIVVSAHSWFPWFILIYVAVFALQYIFIIRFEEKFLEGAFKDEYENYRKHVPSFFPTFKPYPGGSRIKPDFRIGYRSEKNTINISLIIYAIVLAIFFVQKFIGWWS